MIDQYYHPDTDQARKWNVPLPTVEVHGSDEDIRKNLKSLKAHSWRMEGPGLLVADTEMGRLAQSIPPNYICKGTDKNGHPILEKITPKDSL